MVWFSVSILFAVDAETTIPHELKEKLLLLSSPGEEDAPRALRHCCMFGYRFVFNAMLEHGVDVTAKDHKGRTAVFYVPPEAAWYKYFMRKLLAAGARVTDRTAVSHTTLVHHYVGFDYSTNRPRIAARTDLTPLRRGLEFACANGLSINEQDLKGRTPLSLCMFPAEIKMLLSMGACIRTAFQSNAGLCMLFLQRDPAALALLFHPGSPLRTMTWADMPVCHWAVDMNQVEFQQAAYKADPVYFSSFAS
jgi:hypothetical protein